MTLAALLLLILVALGKLTQDARQGIMAIVILVLLGVVVALFDPTTVEALLAAVR